METQLVRLDAPYNIICGNGGQFGLHIATLIVVKETVEGVPEGKTMSDTLSVASYPVVAGNYKMAGETWLKTELKDCHVVCPQDVKFEPLSSLKRVMEYCAKQKVLHFMDRIPVAFSWAMTDNDIMILMPHDHNNKVITDYEVCLEFDEVDKGKTCMAFASKDSDFYFYMYFDNKPPFIYGVPTYEEAIVLMGRQRNQYLRLFEPEGLRSITFTTKNENYQWFVDKLNSYSLDD